MLWLIVGHIWITGGFLVVIIRKPPLIKARVGFLLSTKTEDIKK
jgi:hypothetical protein